MSFSIARFRAHASQPERRVRLGSASVLLGCTLLSCALAACTLTSDSYDPPVIEAPETGEAPLQERPVSPAVQDPAAAPPDTSGDPQSSEPQTPEQLPSNVNLDPGEGNQSQNGVQQPSEGTGAPSSDPGAAPPPEGPSQPDAGPQLYPEPPESDPEPQPAPEPEPEPQPEPVPEPAPVCPGSTFGASCYEFFGTFSSWAAAEASCVGRGGHLASVQSSEENVFLDRWTAELGIPAGNGVGLWLGGADGAQDDNFRWSDGSAFTFLGWAPGQPNDGIGAADCVEKRNDGTGWYDRRCTDSLPYVCEKQL